MLARPFAGSYEDFFHRVVDSDLLSIPVTVIIAGALPWRPCFDALGYLPSSLGFGVDTCVRPDPGRFSAFVISCSSRPPPPHTSKTSFCANYRSSSTPQTVVLMPVFVYSIVVVRENGTQEYLHSMGLSPVTSTAFTFAFQFSYFIAVVGSLCRGWIRGSFVNLRGKREGGCELGCCLNEVATTVID